MGRSVEGRRTPENDRPQGKQIKGRESFLSSPLNGGVSRSGTLALAKRGLAPSRMTLAVFGRLLGHYLMLSDAIWCLVIFHSTRRRLLQTDNLFDVSLPRLSTTYLTVNWSVLLGNEISVYSHSSFVYPQFVPFISKSSLQGIVTGWPSLKLSNMYLH